MNITITVKMVSEITSWITFSCKMLDRKPFALRFLLLYLGIMTVVIFGIYGSGYNAADFVYMQF